MIRQKHEIGHAMAQAFSHHIVTTETWVHSHASPCGIHGG
jgi:hypothetical protein